MAEYNLFKLLDFDHNDEEAKQHIDADAIIKEAQQNPRDVDLIYTFSRGKRYGPRCPPLHQAIALGLGAEVIHALNTPIAIRQKLNWSTALHLALQHRAPLD
eukprot:9393892-Ditylum_brightwellii.AAC.1